VKGCPLGFRFGAGFRFGGQEITSKPPQSIFKQ
jgi:hypothetical protein